MLIRRDRAMLAVTMVLDIAFHGGRSSTVSAADVAARLGMARRGMEPLLQALSRSGLLASVRGPHGGYRLGRPRRAIRLAEIADAVTERRAGTAADEGAGTGKGGALQTCVIDPLWSALDAAARAQLAGLTVEDLLQQATAAGLKPPAAEPIMFAI